MMKIKIVSLVLVCCLTGTIHAASIDGIAWMAGHWMKSGDGNVSEEVWTDARGGIMVGLHRTVRQGGRAWFEYLRIEDRGETLIYVASPAGKSPTEFTASEWTDSKIVFENPEHDFPQRIIYTREGDSLCAAAEAGEGTDRRIEKWCWDRVE